MRTPIVLAALLAVSPPALAADDTPGERLPDREELQELGQSALDELRRAFREFEGQMDGLLESIPRYRLPYRDDQGNIIIPRIQPDGAPEPEGDPEFRRI